MKVDRLKRSYEINSAVRAICDHMAQRANNQNETYLHRIVSFFEQESDGYKRADIITALRLLEEAECGNYVEGRRGWKSRFVWSVKSKLVAAIARGTQSQAAEEIAGEEAVAEEMVEHTYVLRPDLTLSFDLPSNLSCNEAERLSRFLGSLSFEE